MIVVVFSIPITPRVVVLIGVSLLTTLILRVLTTPTSVRLTLVLFGCVRGSSLTFLIGIRLIGSLLFGRVRTSLILTCGSARPLTLRRLYRRWDSGDVDDVWVERYPCASGIRRAAPNWCHSRTVDPLIYNATKSVHFWIRWHWPRSLAFWTGLVRNVGRIRLTRRIRSESLSVWVQTPHLRSATLIPSEKLVPRAIIPSVLGLAPLVPELTVRSLVTSSASLI